VTRWELRLAAGAKRSLDALPDKAAAAVVEFVLGPLCDAPQRVGKPLLRELAGYWVARRGPYRIVYRLEEAAAVVNVVRIDHRSRVYRRR